MIVSDKERAQERKREEYKMASKKQGIYEFADGTTLWVYGMSAAEKRRYIAEHGPIIKFTPC